MHKHATGAQERAHLWCYLHTRDDLVPGSRHLQKLRKQARAMHLDWHLEPPPPRTFDQYLAEVTHRAPPKPAVKSKVTAKAKRSEGGAHDAA